MSKWLLVVVLVMLVLTAAMGLRNLAVGKAPAPALIASGGAPVPPGPWMSGGAPVPPGPWMSGGAPVPPGPWNR